MSEAFDHGFSLKIDGIILVGADCPELSADILLEGIQALNEHELVLGPAFDGGYYCIGLSEPQPQLFKGISWGRESVLAETLAKADELGMQIYQLPKLHDIDRPEDLPLWENIQPEITQSSSDHRQ